MDRTLILVKPDAFARGLTGEIIARFERKGLRLVALKQMTVDGDLAKRHYAEHDGKPFFGELVEFITSGPARRDGPRGRPGRHRRAPGDRRDEPARGLARLDPRRLRDRRRPEHGPRLGLVRVRRPRGRAVLPRAVPGRRTPDAGGPAGPEAGPRQPLAPAPRDPREPRRRVRGPAGRRRRGGRGRARRRRRGERAAQGARRQGAPGGGRARRRHDRRHRASRSGASRPTRTRRARRCATSPAARTASSAASRSSTRPARCAPTRP